MLNFLPLGAYAQKSLIHTMPDQNYLNAIDLFAKQKYADAQYYYQKVIDNPSNSKTTIKAEAEYQSAICALELFNPDAEFLLQKFISDNPENKNVNEAYFNMAHYQYVNKKYSKAIVWFEKIDAPRLSSTQLSEFHFEAGYSYFMLVNYEKARVHFFEIKDVDNKYAAPALYYYSHIAYEQKNYETALEGFLRLKDDDTFAPIVPYYVSQIYFLQKKYEKVIEYAPPLLDSVVEKRVAEMSRIIGESYFKLGQFKESLPYMEKYAEKVKSMSPEDRYQLAYAYYKAEDFQNAIKFFEPVSNGNSELSQNALYHLADCYLRTDQKPKARMAFKGASSMDFNPDIKENALYNYAVATYELSLSPFNEAVKGFVEYLTLYPNTSRSDDAYNYLMLAYMSTRNYQGALESLDKIKKKDKSVNKATQRIAFYRGLELFNNQKFEDAIDMFDKSMKFGEFDQILKARSFYWKGESNFRLKNYSIANEMYNEFINSPMAASLDEFEMAHYNIGYCFFNMKKYDDALSWFRRYCSLMKDAKSKITADAYNRIADCYFMKLSYWVAIENYDKAMNYGVADADYSLFQKAFALGLVSRPEKKIVFLNQLMKEYPKSAFVDDGLYETGRAYVSLNKNEDALAAFNKLITDFPSSSYVPKSLLQMGLIYYNQDKYAEAITCYKKVAEQYPGSIDSRNALNGLKTVYVDKNEVETYFTYLSSHGESGNVRSSEQDSLTYVAAENIYMSGNCDKSTEQFNNYLKRFSNGNFALNANFYIADCYYRNSKTEQAMSGFEYVISKPHSMFSEQALDGAADISYNKNDFTKALEYYKRLEGEAEIKSNVLKARIGQMRCNFKLANWENAITSAKLILSSEKVPEETNRETHYILAKSNLELKNYPSATDDLKLVSKDTKSAEGAECKYLLAKLYFDQNKKTAAEKEIMNFIDKNTPYQFWLGKSFLLLSDIYLDKHDEFQAIHTLQSILDNYEITNDGIKDEAKDKKEKLLAKNVNLQVQEKQEDIELNINK